MNEMGRYLEEHNYISRNKNKDPLRQQELSKQRAECISNKYNNLVEEKDKEIEKLKNIIFKAHKMIYDNYGVLDKYGIDILDDILTGKELKEGK